MKRIALCVAAILIGIALLSAAVLTQEYRRYIATPAADHGEEVLFTIAKGSGFSKIARDLFAARLIQKPFAFKIYGRLQKAETRIHAGEYLLSPQMTPQGILDALVSGRVKAYRMTIPEGLRITEIAVRAENTGLVSAQAFLDAAMDPELARRLCIKGKTLEGYLFPETYFFTRPVSAQDMVRTMVDRFRQTLTQKDRDRASAMGFSIHEIVTLASIIEKETGASHERPKIAAVFHNRLKRKMRLETDPTVIYGISDFDGNITRRHLRTPTPYNTYVISGLPPGPIASPGRAALTAALWPANTEDLFFVSKKDGTHHFSTTLREHNRAVRKYQLRRRGRNG